ncbi:hypothetical protein GALL_339270 [mine drainage metagenome]|jgi:hypothetical protein|uniref:Uncharacterized protein n=1 Tax=mine drainage metagenome TaxID=410659 RepID=A0A1J5QWN0_9ZZZZ
MNTRRHPSFMLSTTIAVLSLLLMLVPLTKERLGQAVPYAWFTQAALMQQSGSPDTTATASVSVTPQLGARSVNFSTHQIPSGSGFIDPNTVRELRIGRLQPKPPIDLDYSFYLAYVQASSVQLSPKLHPWIDFSPSPLASYRPCGLPPHVLAPPSTIQI